MSGPIRKKGMIDMMNELTRYAIQSLGFPLVGEIKVLHPGSGNAYNFLRDKVEEGSMYTSIYSAYTSMVTLRNDVLLVTPNSHAWKGDTNAGGEALTWSKGNTHMLGLDPNGVGGYQRARFSHAGFTMANFMTVGGDSNMFRHLRWMHGSSTGGASDVTCLTVSGAGNVFEDCCFGGPNDATQASSANYNGVIVSGSHNEFRRCLFGTQNAISRDAANEILVLSGGGHNVFVDCIFKSRAGATTPYFINHSNAGTGGNCTAVFLNCQFINVSPLYGSYNLAVAIVNSAGNTHWLYFDNRCSFAGVTDIVATGNVGNIYWGGAGANSDDSALDDRLKLGIAQNPVV